MRRLVFILIVALLGSLANASVMTVAACPQPVTHTITHPSAPPGAAVHHSCDEPATPQGPDASVAHHGTASHACCMVLGLPMTWPAWHAGVLRTPTAPRAKAWFDLGVYDVIFKPPRQAA